MQLHKTFSSRQVQIPVDDVLLDGELVMPARPKGFVIFAHGSGSSRHSPRNKLVAEVLQDNSFATFLVDLLSENEDVEYVRRFDIGLLAHRLVAITNWAAYNKSTEHLSFGYFGASTGAAAALLAADALGERVRAVVSRGGRVDMAHDVVMRLRVPTLLIVGQDDLAVRELSENILPESPGRMELSLVPHATHLFEEPGALQQVASLAVEWFKEYMGD